MLRLLLLLGIFALVAPAAAPAADGDSGELLEKAPCHVCTFGAAGHGVEKVAGHTEVDGIVYYFCSKDCKARFDADPAGYLPMQYPQPALDFSLTTMAGESASLADYKGQWLLLDFWATWCQPCVKLMPELDKLDRARADLTVLGISIDEDAEKAVKFAKKREVGYALAVDDPDTPVWDRYHVKAIPTAFLIDPEGRIVRRWVGEWNHEEIVRALDEAGKKAD